MSLVLGEESRTSGGLVSCLMQQASSSRVYLRQGFVCKWLNKEVLPRRNLRESGKQDREGEAEQMEISSEVPHSAWFCRELWNIKYAWDFVSCWSKEAEHPYPCSSWSLAIGYPEGQRLPSPMVLSTWGHVGEAAPVPQDKPLDKVAECEP